MDKWIALNNQTAGRDKLARLIQYLSRAIWDGLEQNDCNPSLCDKFKTLEYILSSFRKLLRFGKSLDVFYSSLKTIHYPDITIRVTLTFSKLAQSLFLFSDHILWLSRTGLFRNIDSKKWTKVSNKYWFLAIIMNLCRDVYEILCLIDFHNATKKSGCIYRTNLSRTPLTTKELVQLAHHSFSILHVHKDIVVDTVKNLCDVFIPLTALGYTNFTPRTIGIFGAISSIAGLTAILEPNARLMPT